MKNTTLLTFTLFMLLFTVALHAQIRRVPGEYATIQAAVDAAAFGDTVLVAPGTYLENIRIEGNARVLTLASNFIFSGDTNDINNTIIDASQPQNPNYGMGILLKNQDTTIMPKITGFTITGGTGYYKTYGGGIYSGNAIPVIEYNHIINCSVTGTQPNGGGIRIAGANPYTICIIRHNVIKNCTVTPSPTGVEAQGAGLSMDNVRAIIENNIITDNIITGNSSCNSHGGGIYYGSSIPAEYAPQLNIRNNEIRNNSIQSWHAEGAGIILFGILQYIVEGNTISQNHIQGIGNNGFALGGGLNIYDVAEGSVVSSNIIADNSVLDGPQGSERSGGGIYITHLTNQPTEVYLMIEKNRITGNTAVNGAGLFFQKIGARLVNNFISNNHAEKSGGAICFQGPASVSIISEIINNTISENSANGPEGDAGSIFFNGTMKVMLMNDLFYSNQATNSDEMVIVASTIQMNNCDINTNEVTGAWTGEDNFYADPEFIDEMAWDCWSNEAPCSNSGIDQIFIFYQWFNAPAEDILNNERPQDEFVDVGAVEVNMCFVGSPEPVVSRQSLVVSYPNPLSDHTTFEYALEESGMVKLEIFNQVGQVEAVLVNERQAGGNHQLIWNADGMPAGIYYYSLTSGKQTNTGKIIIVE